MEGDTEGIVAEECRGGTSADTGEGGRIEGEEEIEKLFPPSRDVKVEVGEGDAPNLQAVPTAPSCTALISRERSLGSRVKALPLEPETVERMEALEMVDGWWLYVHSSP